MSQLALDYGDPRAGATRKRDPQTSRVAASRCKAGSQRQRIMRSLSSRLHGATTEELEDELRVVRNTLSARLKVMEKDGLVETFGTRLNRAGNPMQVWYLSATSLSSRKESDV